MPELGKSVIKECDNKQGDITQTQNKYPQSFNIIKTLFLSKIKKLKT